MDALEAIRTRMMRPRVEDHPPSRGEIEELLELAVRAPTHHLTQPWRFYVLTGDGRSRLATAIAEAAVASGTDQQEARDDADKKVARAPVIIVFTCLPADQADVVEAEEMAAVAMAVENVLIGAHAMGLGAMFRTGPAAYHPAIARELGLAARERVVGFLYLGRPAGQRALTERTSAQAVTRWVES